MERGLALKAIVTYLVGNRSTTHEEISGDHPKANDKGFDLKGTTSNYFRLNAREEIYRTEGENFRKAVQAVIKRKKLTIPPFLHDAASTAGLKIPERDHPEDVPQFIDSLALPRLTGDLRQMAPIVERYSGCWRLYRVSSTDFREKPNLNVGFLSIKPVTYLEEAEQNTAQFSLYQRSDEAGDYRDTASKTFGVIVSAGDFVTLIGERAKGGGAGMPFPGMLFWRHIESGARDKKFIDGLCCIPNSQGSDIVGAYFCAEYIEGSDTSDGAKYFQTKTAETASGKLGTLAWTEIKSRVQDAAVRDKIEKLIARSRHDLVFRA